MPNRSKDAISVLAAAYAASAVMEAENDRSIDAVDLLLATAAEMLAALQLVTPSVSLKAASQIVETLVVGRIATIEALSDPANATAAGTGIVTVAALQSQWPRNYDLRMVCGPISLSCH